MGHIEHVLATTVFAVGANVHGTLMLPGGNRQDLSLLGNTFKHRPAFDANANVFVSSERCGCWAINLLPETLWHISLAKSFRCGDETYRELFVSLSLDFGRTGTDCVTPSLKYMFPRGTWTSLHSDGFDVGSSFLRYFLSSWVPPLHCALRVLRLLM